MTPTYTTGNLPNNTVTVSGTVSSGSGYTIGNLPNIGSNSAIYTTSSTSTSNWSVQNVSNNQITNNNGQAVMTVPADSNTLEVTGNMVINGVDLEERLNIIEKVLQIPERDVKLETSHPNLKKMFDDYITALAKYRTWQAIKGNNND